MVVIFVALPAAIPDFVDPTIFSDEPDSQEHKKPRRQQLSEGDKIDILTMRSDGVSIREIARITSRNPSCISRFLRRMSDERRISRKPGSGRPRKTSDMTDRLIVRCILKNRFVAATQVARNLSFQNLSVDTIRRRIKASGEFSCYWAARKPALSKKPKA